LDARLVLEPPFWRFVANGRKLIFSSNHLCPKTVRYYYQALKEFAPDCLFAYPTSLESLCLLMRENELSLRIPLVIATSEAMRTEARVLAMQVLNAEVLRYRDCRRTCAHANWEDAVCDSGV